MAEAETRPKFEWDCVTPPQLVVDESPLGNPYLFDPRAKIAFSGPSVRVLLYVDGFKTRILDVTTNGDASELQPIGLTHKFYDVTTSDRHDGPVRHTVRMLATDSRGLRTTSTCKFELPW